MRVILEWECVSAYEYVLCMYWNGNLIVCTCLGLEMLLWIEYDQLEHTKDLRDIAIT